MAFRHGQTIYAICRDCQKLGGGYWGLHDRSVLIGPNDEDIIVKTGYLLKSGQNVVLETRFIQYTGDGLAVVVCQDDFIKKTVVRRVPLDDLVEPHQVTRPYK